MKPRANFQGVSPVLMSSSCDVLASNSAIPDSGQLTYPFRKAVLIEEIRWTMRTANGNENQNLGALVSVKMQLGQRYLTRDSVPVWLFGTRLSWLDEQHTSALLATPQSFSRYRWRLPEPLYVEAGQVLSSVFSRGADVLSSINVQVTYVGRTVSPDQPRPRVVAIPYVAPFVSTAGLTYEQSNEFDLLNPFDIPLRIQRLTGRVLQQTEVTTNVYKIIEVLSLTPAVAGGGVTILMNDSWGGKMVNDRTGPSDIFDCLRAAWTVDTMMPPKGIYEARIWNMDTSQRVHIAMIGTREETL